MQAKTSVVCSLRYHEARLWLFATAFTIGNILFPQLCHLVPKGGLILLPIYFFTLIGAYKYGWRTGLVIAVASPLINHLAFGMPPASALVPILVKSVTLALIAGLVALRVGKATLPALFLVVVGYQLVGGIFETLTAGVGAALVDWKIGFPGLLLQLFGGWLVIRKMPEF